MVKPSHPAPQAPSASMRCTPNLLDTICTAPNFLDTIEPRLGTRVPPVYNKSVQRQYITSRCSARHIYAYTHASSGPHQ